ncbi:MAG TPA: hypothetical protein VHT97_04420 [Acidimicrobiales bacterium]|nr:hypothetical protein [Acidimicrobiales bacterium]
MPTLGERIVEHLTVNGASLDDAELAEALGVHRAAIAETCRQLEADGLVVRNIAGGTRSVAAVASVASVALVASGTSGAPVASAAPSPAAGFERSDPFAPASGEAMFPAHARRVLSARWGTALSRRPATLPGGEALLFELVSGNGRIVGDVVWLEGRGHTAEAKWAAIAEAVLIVGHVIRADRRFLVFGQERDVLGRWLDRYRPLLDDVEVWFLEGDRLERLA